MAREIVDVPIKHGDFSIAMLVLERLEAPNFGSEPGGFTNPVASAQLSEVFF